MSTTAEYGYWQSPLSAAKVAEKKGARQHLTIAGENLFFVQYQPLKGGISQICSVPLKALQSQQPTDDELTALSKEYLPEGFSAQSMVHEYGGISFYVTEKQIYFVNASDQQIYARLLNAEQDEASVVAITNAKGYRFADLQWDTQHQRIIAVAEFHTASENNTQNENSAPALPENMLVAVSPAGDINVLHQGHDFYTSPRLNHDATQLAFITWDFPDMPWDKTILHVGENHLSPQTDCFSKLIDQPQHAPQQPQWHHDGSLYYLDDNDDGFGQLYHANAEQLAECSAPREPLFAVDGEIGMPPWQFGFSQYNLFEDGSVGFIVCQNAQYQLGIWSATTAKVCLLDSDAIVFDRIISDAAGRYGYCLAAFADAEMSIAQLDIANLNARLLMQPNRPDHATSYGEPLAITLPSGATTHAFYYPPCSSDYTADPAHKPPLLIMAHGGPTSQTSLAYSSKIQYWTSRGFAVADVNYRGSTGFGRAYREALYSEWGIADVEDVAAVANHLVTQGLVDERNLIIRGGSAGGYLVLAAMAFQDTFTIGAVYYGISDITLLAEDTHKFEYKYPEKLIAPYPEQKDIYIERSPLYHLDGMDKPIIVFQGAEDKVVPPNQSEKIVEALTTKAVPVEYALYEGEKHGFRQPENVIDSLERELAFYQNHMVVEYSDKNK